MLQAASPALQSGASPLCFAAAAWDARPSRSLNCPPPPPAQPCSGDDLAGFGGSPDGSNRTLTSEFEVVHLQALHATAPLASPAVALQHLPMQFTVAVRIQSESGAFAADLHEAFRLTSDRKASCCGLGRNL